MKVVLRIQLDAKSTVRTTLMTYVVSFVKSKRSKLIVSKERLVRTKLSSMGNTCRSYRSLGHYEKDNRSKKVRPKRRTCISSNRVTSCFSYRDQKEADMYISDKSETTATAGTKLHDRSFVCTDRRVAPPSQIVMNYLKDELQGDGHNFNSVRSTLSKEIIWEVVLDGVPSFIENFDWDAFLFDPNDFYIQVRCVL